MCEFGAIILAAGTSERMHEAKLLLPIQHQPIIQYVVDAASDSKINRIVIVTGAHARFIKGSIQGTQKVSFIHNEQYKEGMGTSLRIGMKEMTEKVDAAFVFLGDQPFVSRHVIDCMMDHYIRHRNEGTRIVRPSYRGKAGHPILFSSELFPLFVHLKGDIGGKEIINQHKDEMDVLSFSNEWWGKDIDTQEDLKEVRNHLARLADRYI